MESENVVKIHWNWSIDHIELSRLIDKCQPAETK